MRTAHSVLRLVFILSSLAQDALRFLLLCTRSGAAIKAENMFLRKQLALYLEREVKPRRATDATTRWILVGHLEDQFLESPGNSGPPSRPRFPSPEQLKTLPMPAEEGLRLDVDRSVFPREEPREEDQRQPQAMQAFLDDYDLGKRQGRYVDAELPSRVPGQII